MSGLLLALLPVQAQLHGHAVVAMQATTVALCSHRGGGGGFGIGGGILGGHAAGRVKGVNCRGCQALGSCCHCQHYRFLSLVAQAKQVATPCPVGQPVASRGTAEGEGAGLRAGGAQAAGRS